MKRAGYKGALLIFSVFAFASTDRGHATNPVAPRYEDALSVLSYNVYGHPLFAAFQRPERFAKIAAAFQRDFSQTQFIALQESHVPQTEILGEGFAHQVEGACGIASGFRPTGLRLFSNFAPEPEVERYVFAENAAGLLEMLPESTMDCAALRASRETKKGFLAVPFTVRGNKTLVVNLHLSPSAQRRKHERRLLFAWLKSKPTDWSLVVVGDFNEDLCALPNLRQTWNAMRLQNLTCSVGDTVGGWRKGIWQGAFFGGQIDHILYRGAYVRPVRRRVFHEAQNGLHFSDHDGVWGRWVPIR